LEGRARAGRGIDDDVAINGVYAAAIEFPNVTIEPGPLRRTTPEVAERSSRELLRVDQVEPDEVVANGRGSLERCPQVVKRPGSSN
jgi:hypothetical protein